MIFIKKNTMKDIKKQLRYLLSLNETLENKADHLINKIKEMEMDEAYGDMEGLGDKTSKFDSKDWGKYKIDYKKFLTPDSTTKDKFVDDYLDDEDEEENNEFSWEDDDIEDDDDFSWDEGYDDLVTEGEMCECGGMMREGECMECGMMKEGIYDFAGKFPKKQSFDYIEEEDGIRPSELRANCKEARRIASLPDADDVSRDYAESECEKAGMGLNESKKLVGKQRKLDKNKNNKIDAEDFKLLRKSKKHKSEVDEEEMEEGNEFSGELEKARKAGKKTFKVDGKTYPVKESIEYHISDNEGDIIKLNENELIDLIENIVNEEKIKGLKTIGKPKGLTTYEKAHKDSGKENEDYIKSVTKKMKDYLKDGSKGGYDMNPKMFPQGNGELGKMSKKAFQMTDDLEDFNYEIGGQQFPIPDEIGYDEKRMEKYFKGDSTTGNAPGGNALDSKANERFDKMRKKNTLKKIKDQSYKRVTQPVFNETSTDDKGKLNLKLETMNERKINILNEEFDRMKELLGYNRKTQ
jgi:hypothetical protein